MSFLTIPIYFLEDDCENKEACGLEIERKEGEISININNVCAYNEMDNGHVLIRMSNGDCYECLIDIETFEDILTETENIFDLTKITEN